MIRKIGDVIRARRLRKADALAAQDQLMKAAGLYLKALGGKDFGMEHHAVFGLLSTSLGYGNLAMAEQVLPQAESMVKFLAGHGDDGDQEAVNEMRAMLHSFRSMILRYKRRFPESLAEAEKAVQASESYENRYERAIMLKHAGRLDEAIAEYRILLDEKSEAYVRQSLTGYLFLAGKTDEAIASHRSVSAEERRETMHNEAWIAACRGDRKQCLTLIRESFRYGSPEYLISFYNMDVEFDPFRDDPEFPKMDRDVG